ncbi:MAG: precorrin-8X methylmutase [Chloroflexi bacterium]|nr:precorrin-8X methylmutase [Chloroflexota bacterium]MDA1269633.1 precorrin-8X methylmutase [Chloroflexota bacterium]
MSLVEKYALLPEEIDRQSIEVVEASLPDLNGLTPEERYVVFRIVRAEGDPEISRYVGFSPGAVERGIAAIKAKAAVVTDVRMVEVGISKALLGRCGLTTYCQIDTPNTAARAKADGTTRSVAAIRELAPRLNGAIAVVGNAPTALLALLDMIKEGQAAPALVIGMPVGFIACAESKAELAKVDVPYISIWERRGGSSAAAATVNALLGLALQEVAL